MKIQYINNLRAVACFLVILTHAAMPALDASFGIYMVIFSLIASPSSELFVMISSCLLAPTNLKMTDFYKKRFSKLLPPFIFWSICTLALKLFQERITFAEFVDRILLIPLVPAVGIYWFVYTICGLYLIIPLLSPWLKECSKKELQGIILIWLITLFLPYLNVMLNQEIYSINGNYYFVLFYYGGFIGYLFLGIYLRRFPIIIKNKLKFSLFMSALIIVGTLPILLAYIFDRSLLVIARDNLSITSAAFVIAIFTFFQNVKMYSYVEIIFNKIAKYSFGIYLIHFIIIRDVLWHILEIYRLPHPVIETPVVAILALSICFLIVKLISYLPGSKYIIGA